MRACKEKGSAKMRRWKVETFRLCDEPKPPETIEADEICPVGQYVVFYEHDGSEEYGGGRIKAVRQNCNVTEITEEEK